MNNSDGAPNGAATAVARADHGQSFAVPYTQARAMLEAATRVDEAREIRDRAEAFRIYAQKAHDREMEVMAAEIRLRAERKAGEILIAAAEATLRRTRAAGRPKSVSSENAFSLDALTPTLAELGVTRGESFRWQRLARLPEPEFEARVQRLRGPGAKLSTNAFLSPAFSSGSNDYLTPRDIVDAAIAVMGAIDLDPAAETRGPRANVPARGHFIAADDALARPWHGRIFLNPPYGREVADFVAKLVQEFRAGRVAEAILLAASRTDTEWFCALGDFPACFVAGRLRFRSTAAPAAEAAPAPFPSAIFYLGPNRERFAEHFSVFGPIYMRELAMAERPERPESR